MRLTMGDWTHKHHRQGLFSNTAVAKTFNYSIQLMRTSESPEGWIIVVRSHNPARTSSGSMFELWISDGFEWFFTVKFSVPKICCRNSRLSQWSFDLVFGAASLWGAVHVRKMRQICRKEICCLEPQTTIYKWLFQLDDSQSLHRKWLFHQTSIFNWLFGVPGWTCLSMESMLFVKSTAPLTRSSRGSFLVRGRRSGGEKIRTRLMQGLVSYGMVLDVKKIFASAYLDLLDM